MRNLSIIAREIKSNWKNPYFGAVPYINAMLYLENIHQNYGLDSAETIVRYCLANASTFRGEVARNIKKELNQMLKN